MYCLDCSPVYCLDQWLCGGTNVKQPEYVMDALYQVAIDPNVPTDVRYDIIREMQKVRHSSSTEHEICPLTIKRLKEA